MGIRIRDFSELRAKILNEVSKLSVAASASSNDVMTFMRLFRGLLLTSLVCHLLISRVDLFVIMLCFSPKC